MRLRADRCPPRSVVATTAASAGTSATASSSAAMCALRVRRTPTERRHADESRPRPTTTAIRTEVTSTADGRERTPRRGDPRDAEHRRSHEEGNDGVEAVVTRVRHRREVGEHVREELRHAHGGEAGREEEQPAERDGEPQEIRDVGTREERTEHRARIGEQRLDDALRRPAHLVVEAVVAARVTAVRRRDHDVDREERPGESGGGDHALRRPASHARARTRRRVRRSGTPINSPVDIASTAQSPNGSSRFVSRNQMQ